MYCVVKILLQVCTFKDEIFLNLMSSVILSRLSSNGFSYGMHGASFWLLNLHVSVLFILALGSGRRTLSSVAVLGSPLPFR